MVKGVKTASGEVINLKTSYELGEKSEAFYTGGGVQFSKDGRHLLTTCSSAVKVLSVDTGLVEKTIEEEEDLVTSFAVSGEGTLVIGWRSLLLRQYTLDNCKCTRSWKGHLGPVIAMDFDATSTLLATGSSDSTVKVWDCTKNYCTHNLRGSKGMVGVVRFHPDPERVLLLTSASIDCSIRVWDLSSSRCVHVLSGHVSAVTALAIPVDGTVFLSSGRDKVVHVWDLEGGAAKKTIPVFESVEGLILLPDTLSVASGPIKRALRAHRKAGIGQSGLLFATAGDKGVIRVWSSEGSGPPCLTSCGRLDKDSPASSSSKPEQTPSEGGRREGEGEGEERERDLARVYTSLHLCEELGVLCGVTHDHNLVLFDLPQLSLRKQLIGYLDEVLDISLVGEGESHVAVATNSEEVKVFCRETGSCQLLSGHSGIVLSLSSTHNGRVLATGSKDNTVRLWRMDSSTRLFECVAMGTGHTHAIGAVAMSRLKSSFVVSGSQDCTIKVWKIGRSLVEGEAGLGEANQEKEREIKKLKVKYTQLAHDKDINSLDVSPNDKLIVSGSQDKTAKLWQSSNGALLGKFKGHRRGVWSVKFSPIDQCVATGSGDGTVKLWAVADFTCVKTFGGHTSSVLNISFLTRGMQLASCGGDGLVKVWTIKTNECVATLNQHTEKVWCLACAGDGREIVSGGADSLLCYWKDVSEAVEEEEQLKREDQILREQELANLLHRGDYLRAVGVAISLDQPFRVLKILQDLLDEGGLDGKFKDTILSLREDQIYSILRYASRWNTNARHCPVAQSVLSVVLRSQPPEKMMEMEDIKVIVEGLLPYTERHYQRMARLQQLSSFVDYTWQCMKLPSSSSQQLLAVDGLGGQELGGPSHHQQHTAPLSPVMAAADSTTQADHDEVAMAIEGQLTMDGGGGDSASDDEASGDDDHAITSSTSSSRAKTKGSRKEKLKSRLKKLKNRKTKLYHLSGFKKDRTIKLKKK